MSKNINLIRERSRYIVTAFDGCTFCPSLASALELVNTYRKMFYDRKRGILK